MYWKLLVLQVTFFQVKDMLVFEIKKGVDTLYTSLHMLIVEPGENLKKFYEEFNNDTCNFKGIQLIGQQFSHFEDDNDIQKCVGDVAVNVIDKTLNIFHIFLLLAPMYFTLGSGLHF